jgi:predicted ester cyclase
MKKYFLLAASAMILLACSEKSKNEGGMSDAAKKNLEAHHAISKTFETKDFSKLGDYMAEDAIDHAGEDGDVKGIKNIIAEYEKMIAGFETMKSEVIKELADDEYVMSWMNFSGTLKTEMMGMKPGETFNSKSIEVSRFKNGKAIEHWTFMEPSEVMKMMGGGGNQQQPPPEVQATADSTGK